MMQDWFLDAKLGIFIHWGIYSVKGVGESWSFYHDSISYEDYMDQLTDFTANKYDPCAWAKLFKRAGAKYAVLTTKHHDGVALWDTKANDLSVVHQTPAARDLVSPYVGALRGQGLKVGLYYSHLDWSHPDYASIWRTDERGKQDEIKKNRFTHPSGAEDFAAWNRFLNFHRVQMEELVHGFGSIDLLWFDGDWERDAEQWRFREFRNWLDRVSPQTILNSRMWNLGDYATPEQGIPVVAPKGPWEFCVTMNRSWGYQPHDTEYKSVEQLIWMFAETIGLGGNMLLDIGPKEDGTIVSEEVERLEGLGSWISSNEEAIYSTVAGLPRGHYYGPSTMSKDGKTIFLFYFGEATMPIAIKGLRSKVKRVSVVKTDQELVHRSMGGAPWLNIPGILWIELPRQFVDPRGTVIKLELEDLVDLYREEGQAITDND